MREIMNGLPSIPDDEYGGETDYTFDGSNVGTIWTCRVCQVKNPIASPNCSNCRSAKPSLTVRVGGAGGGGIQIGGLKKKKSKR